MSTSFGWEDRGSTFRERMNAGCAGKTEISWERVPYLSALEGVFTTRHYTNPRLPLPYLCKN